MKLFKYLSYLKFFTYKFRKAPFVSRRYIINGEKKYLKGNLFSYKISHLSSHASNFPSSFFYVEYFKKLKQLKQFFTTNSVNKYITYKIKYNFIKYFKHNNSLKNYKGKYFYRIKLENKYIRRFKKKGKDPC